MSNQFKELETCEFECETDEESDEDDDASEIKRMLKAKTPTRNADMFESKDPTAGQLFVFVGKSERGKTHFLKWLVKDQMRRSVNPLKFGMVMVRTTYKNSYRFVPQEHIFQGYDEEILQQYVSNLEGMYEENGSVPPNFIIMDDLVGILNNQTSWFTNFIGTYRHLNINLFIAVQFLTGRRAISPIMREQTNFCIMFNSKTTRTIQNLYDNFGQLFESKRKFQEYLFANTEPSSVGPYACIVYNESEDDKDKNYTPMRAPAKI